MGKLHSKHTVVTIGGDDISAYTNSTTANRTADSHDTTGYGMDSKEYAKGLKDATITIEGYYDTTETTGTDDVLLPLYESDLTTEFVLKLNGTGTGKEQIKCDVLVTAYNKSSPVADMVTWTAELQVSGDVDTTPQT